MHRHAPTDSLPGREAAGSWQLVHALLAAAENVSAGRSIHAFQTKKHNPCLCVSSADARMSAVVLTDLHDPFPSDEDIRIDNENLDALAQSVAAGVDPQILCVGLIYLLLGCLIAYVDCKRLKRWQHRVRRCVAA